MEDSDGEDPQETPELPVEVSVYISSFLHAADRKEASSACRRWYAASQDPRFQKNVTFSFPASASSSSSVRGSSRRRRCSSRISQSDGFSVSKSLLSEVGRCSGPKVDSSASPGCSVTEASSSASSPRLTSSRRSDLRGSDSLFMSGAFSSREEQRRQVRSASIASEESDSSDSRYSSDLTFNRLTGCAPRSRRLSSAGCHIAFEFDPYRGCPVGAVEDSSASSSLRNLRKSSVEQRSTSKASDLSRTSITPESSRIIAQVQGLVSEESHLQGCKESTDYSVEVSVQQQPRLSKSDISGCTESTSRSVQAVAQGSKSSTFSSLSRDWRITEKGSAESSSNSCSTSSDVSECLHISGTESVKGSKGSSGARAKSRVLNSRSCTYLRDSAVFSLTQLLGDSSRELDSTSCVNVTDSSVCAIATYSQKSEVSRSGWCKEVTDWGSSGMVQEGPCDPDDETGDRGPRFTRTFGNMGFFKPPRMPFEERPKSVTQNDSQQFKQRAGASSLASDRLQESDSSGCTKITDSSITQVVRFPESQRSSSSMLPESSDGGSASVGRRCRSLTSSALSHCPAITDRGSAQAAPHLQRSQHSYLSCCNNITDRTSYASMQHCRRSKTSDVSRCKNISVTTVDLLQSQSPFSENVHYKSIGVADLSSTD